MDRAIIALSLFVVTVATSAFLSWKAIGLFTRFEVVDRPTSRGVSQRVVPRAGGIPVALAVLSGLALSFSFDVFRFPSEVERLLLLIAGGTVVAIVLVVDDAVGLSVKSKLGIQVLAAGLVVLPRLRGPLHGISLDQFNLPLTGQVSIPLLIAIPATVLWFVGMMNAVNWADGIDGMAASLSLVAAAIMFLHTWFWPRHDPQFTISLLALTIAAAICGFLPFNWNPARIMLGDSGANFLGFMLAGLSIIGGAKMATALLVMGLPLLDVVWVVTSRKLAHRPITGADMSHLHHRLLRRGWSQSRIVMVVSMISFAFGMAALLLPNREAKLLAMAVLVLLMALTIRQIRAEEI
ncbi:MAG: glycosyltransferase family 4 protein [Thermomicrobiales bacterium]